jgi:hypothetical protein
MVNRFIGPLLVLSILVSSRPVAAQGTTIPEALARHGSSLERSVGVWSGPPPSVESLLSSTDLVVRGVVTQTRSYLSPNQRDVYTDYEVRRPRVLYRVGSSSDGRPGVDSMTVTLLGGTIELNGLTFKAVHKGLPSLPSGEEHILLLRQSDSRFFIAGDYFGAFRVVRGRVEPSVRKGGFAEKYKGMPAAEAARALAAATARAHRRQR